MAPPYDPYDSPSRERGHRYAEERREYREPRYDEGRDSYLKPISSSRDLVPRYREESDLSVEEIRREFPPPDSYRDIRRARSAGPYDYDSRSRGSDREYRDRKGGESSLYYEKERQKSRQRVLSQKERILAAVAGAALVVGGKEVFDHRKAKEEGHDVERNYIQSGALAAAGALAVYGGASLYNKKAGKEDKKHTYIVHRGRDGRISEYYSDDSDDATAKKGKKSFLTSALGVTSLGAAFKAITGDDHGDRDHHSNRSRRSRSSSSSRSRGSRSGGSRSKMQKAAMASLIAGATEAFRVAKEPGGWKGEKAKRVVTAALGAGTIDAAHDRDKDTKLGLAESVIGGLLSNRLVHGSRKDIYEDKKGRSRSKSRGRSASRGRAAALATVLGAKVLKNRSGSRGGDSDDSRSPHGHRARSRSRSVMDSARKGLAKLVGGGGSQESDRHRGRDYESDDDQRRGGHRHRGHDDGDDYDDYRGSNRGGGRDDDYDNRSHRPRRKGKSDAGSESSLGDSSEDEKRAKKMKGKQILTTGLAAVATIHAAHEVYSSMEKRNARQKAVKEGRLSPEEAKKLKAKAILQDAASVGIAALGIKGAVSELKEAKHMSEECKEFRHERALRQKKRRERQRQLIGVERGRSRADNWSTSAPPRPDRYEYGPRYTDGNPYSAALPAPPVGYDRR